MPRGSHSKSTAFEGHVSAQDVHVCNIRKLIQVVGRGPDKEAVSLEQLLSYVSFGLAALHRASVGGEISCGPGDLVPALLCTSYHLVAIWPGVVSMCCVGKYCQVR
jgi:hypothetical protein